MKRVVILGSTGSIGTQALEVIGSRREEYRVSGLAAGGTDLTRLAEQTVAFEPAVVAIAGTADASPDEARAAFAAELAATARRAGRPAPAPQIQVGADAVTALAGRSHLADVVLNAITGAAGLLATLATLRAGLRLALANKESLVIGGTLVTRLAAPGQIVAVDSEHSAFAQCLRAGRAREVRRLILTASGGPFRGYSRERLAGVTPAQALSHPTWHMGRVITINSATLVNKGLELLEAALLYGVPIEAIQVVVQPTSVVHSGVEFTDGALILQASPPDMRLPIGLALAWPDRLPDVAAPCDWTVPTCWSFEPLDETVFPAVELARRAGRAGGTATAVYNGANEACVDAFCAGRIAFPAITDTIAAVLEEHLAPGGGHVGDEGVSLEAVLAADAWARATAGRRFGARHG